MSLPQLTPEIIRVISLLTVVFGRCSHWSPAEAVKFAKEYENYIKNGQ